MFLQISIAPNKNIKNSYKSGRMALLSLSHDKARSV